jgi:hypothetical protein
MPNWTHNRVSIRRVDDTQSSSDQFEDFCNKTCRPQGKGDQIEVDFDGCAPMPQALREVGNVPTNYIKTIDDLEKAKIRLENAPELGLKEWERESIESQIKMYHNSKEFGHESWYDWSCAIWGTKWNANDGEVERVGDEVLLTFNTAWNQPMGWSAIIIDLYPLLAFHFEWEDEGEGDLIDSEGKIATEETHGENVWETCEWQPTINRLSKRWDYNVPFSLATLLPSSHAVEWFESNLAAMKRTLDWLKKSMTGE